MIKGIINSISRINTPRSSYNKYYYYCTSSCDYSHSSSSIKYIVAAFYEFKSIENVDRLQQDIKQLCLDNNIMGKCIVANEGINATMCAPRTAIDTLMNMLRNNLKNHNNQNNSQQFNNMEYKESEHDNQVFRKLRVVQKKEIVTLAKEVSPNTRVGQYVDVHEWNDLITSDQVLLIDTRNDFEVKLGSFNNAINPRTTKFSELPQWFRDNQQLLESKPKIAMMCTGGIRCEKASSYLMGMGYDNVYHLKGGILKYLEMVPKEKSLWHGECFVFDKRISLTHQLEVVGDKKDNILIKDDPFDTPRIAVSPY